MESQKVCNTILHPLRESLWFRRNGFFIAAIGQVLFASNTEVALDWTPTHGAVLQFGEAGSAYAGMSARQQRSGQREVLTDYA